MSARVRVGRVAGMPAAPEVCLSSFGLFADATRVAFSSELIAGLFPGPVFLGLQFEGLVFVGTVFPGVGFLGAMFLDLTVTAALLVPAPWQLVVPAPW